MRSRPGPIRRTWARALAIVGSAFLRGAYRAADTGRLQADWTVRKQSADAALIPELDRMTARSRDMGRNDPIARSGARAFRRNVIGRGINPRPDRRLANGQPDDAWNAQALALWTRWASNPRLCDIERKRTFAMFERWVMSELYYAGEALVVLAETMAADGFSDLVLQPVEPEQLDPLKTSHELGGGKSNHVRGGVEIDDYGSPVAYHFAATDRSPAVRVLAERVIHVFDPERARQTRGEPRTATVLESMWNMSQYDRAQRQAARAEAQIGLIVTSDAGAEDDAQVDEDGEKKAPRDPLDLAMVSIFRGKPGEKIEGFAPTRPGNLYESFTIAQLRRISAGLGLSYEQLVRDFTRSNYSSLRQGNLEDRREFREVQDLIISQFCQQVYRRKVEIDVAAGRLRPVASEWARDREPWLACKWLGDGWDWVDPENEAQALSIGLDRGLTTLEEIHHARGRDWRDVLRQRALEEQFRSAVGLPGPEPLPAQVVQPKSKGASQ